METMDKNAYQKELEKQMREAELKDKILRRKEKLENYVKETTKNFGFKDKQGSMSDKEFRSSENLLKPGEDPGEGYEGTPDMYPDYEEDEKDQKLGRTSTKEFKAIQKMMDKKSKGGSILVKTKLGRTKPTKLY
jgi:hypothetical protein